VINPFAILTRITTIAGINYAALAGLANNLTLLNFLDSNNEVFHGNCSLVTFSAYHEQVVSQVFRRGNQDRLSIEHTYKLNNSMMIWDKVRVHPVKPYQGNHYDLRIQR
jgi:hypothetical protein